MIAAKIAFAAGAFAASLLGGVGLGSYTIGGFRVAQPVDIIAEMAPDASAGAYVEAPLPQAPVNHVCTGCDAKLYRDVDWYEASYLPEEPPPEEGRWTVADDPAAAEPVPADAVPADESVKAPDGSLAAYEAPVVVRQDSPRG